MKTNIQAESEQGAGLHKEKPYEYLQFSIQAHRYSLDLTQKSLAKRVQISVGYLGLIEQGRVRPSRRLIEKIASVLEIKSEILLGPWTSSSCTKKDE
ncbi:MAG TPA: helix-turn-helix transcriptional regulator [Candidatus Kapabacteria bacterium]|nr:helix-turn-helix transcriptional regulator [Candidatus Kapabacteria bacterium]